MRAMSLHWSWRGTLTPKYWMNHRYAAAGNTKPTAVSPNRRTRRVVLPRSGGGVAGSVGRRGTSWRGCVYTAIA